jgi:hypothetical protein
VFDAEALLNYYEERNTQKAAESPFWR